MSMQARKVEELKNSLRDSNSRMLLTRAPVDSGFASMRMERTLSMSLLESTTSALRPARSTKWLRRLRRRKSKR